MTHLFEILPILPEDTEKIAAAPNRPHQHTYEELIIGSEGLLEHFIDFKTETLEAPFVCFVTKGKTHRVRPQAREGRCRMWVMRFRSEFIPETTFQLYANYHDHANISLQDGPCFQRLMTLCEIMAGEMLQAPPDYGVIRHLLSALFTMIESERIKNITDEGGLRKTQNTTFRHFLELLEAHYKRPEGVNFYAGQLFMSARNLNLICRQVLQKSVSELIEIRKLIEAKNLLTTTDMTVAEIGFELGYKEKAHFTSVFKKKSGQTPTEFREEMRRLIQ